jgi:hypothetical protein
MHGRWFDERRLEARIAVKVDGFRSSSDGIDGEDGGGDEEDEEERLERFGKWLEEGGGGDGEGRGGMT